jgi:hypothetical protein
VGTVYIGLASERGQSARRFQFLGDRGRIRSFAVHYALDMLRRELLAPEHITALRLIQNPSTASRRALRGSGFVYGGNLDHIGTRRVRGPKLSFCTNGTRRDRIVLRPSMDTVPRAIPSGRPAIRAPASPLPAAVLP